MTKGSAQVILAALQNTQTAACILKENFPQKIMVQQNSLLNTLNFHLLLPGIIICILFTLSCLSKKSDELVASIRKKQ